jgi:hypothetical protein
MFQDADCLGCFEVCTDGKCVIDEAELSYCMGTKLMTLTNITGDKENGCFVEPEEQDCTVHGPEFTCSEESGEAKCVPSEETPNT